MQRQIYYPNQLLGANDVLTPQVNEMIGYGALAEPILGTNILLNGFACTPTSTPSLTVNVGYGFVFSQQEVDATPYSTLPTNTNLIQKFASQPSTTVTPFTFVPPVTSGDSRNDLIEIQLQTSDGTSINIPEWGGTTPITVLTPSGSTVINVPNPPISQNENTQRIDAVVIQVKAGIPAPTGSQTTPTPDSGWAGAWVITTTNGVSTITSSNIARYTQSGAPGDLYNGIPTFFILESLTDKISEATGDTRYARLEQVQYYSGIVNGGMIIAQRQPFNLTGMTAGIGLVDAMMGQVTGTTVTSGTLTQATVSNLGLTNKALQFSNVTATGSGQIIQTIRIEANDSANYFNQLASFSIFTQHDVGSPINYTIAINIATAINNFSSVTNIQTSSPISVASATPQLISLTGVSMGNCTNGIEIVITAACGAVTNNNFWFNSAQLNTGAFATPFVPEDETVTRIRCQRRYEKSYEDGVSVGTAIIAGAHVFLTSSTAVTDPLQGTVKFAITKVVSPTINVFSPDTGSQGFAGNSSGDTPIIVGFSNKKSFTIVNSGSPATGQYYGVQFESIADL